MPKSLDEQAMAEYERGMQAVEANRLNDAMRHFDRAVELWSGFVPARIAQANLLIQLQRFDEGMQAMSRIVQEFPDDFLAQYAWGSLLLANGDPDAAVGAFEEAADVVPDDPDLLLMLGDGFMSTEENERGIEMFRRAVALAPNSAHARAMLGRALVADEKAEAALPELERAITLDDRNVDAWYAKGLVQMSLERPEDAVAAFKRAIALDPDYTPSYLALVTVYEHSGRHDEALRAAAQAEARIHDDPELLYSIAQLYAGMQEFQKARELAERLIAVDPEDTEARLLLSAIAMQLGDMETVTREVAYVQQHDPELLNEMAANAGLPPLEEVDEFADEDFDLFPSRRRVEPKLTVGTKGKPGTIYQLKISLLGFEPTIWREVLVPSDFTLAKLHRVIQTVMGWENSHLHEFTVGTVGYTDTRAGLEGRKNEAKVPLHQVAGSRGKFTYLYDFGDNWEVEIKVEKVLPPAKDQKYPICIAGEMAGPPEDTGGVWGYADMLQALEDTDDPEHEEYAEWLGEDYDPEAFDLEEINRRLAKIK
ncbi:MAG: IS1096 element passenger TnpR family protein [Armatimonadota bacterium]